MQLMFFNFIHADGLESSQSDVESDFHHFDSSFADPGQDFWCEVQARGGGGDGTSLAGIDGLIPVAVEGGVVASNVGR